MIALIGLIAGLLVISPCSGGGPSTSSGVDQTVLALHVNLTTKASKDGKVRKLAEGLLRLVPNEPSDLRIDACDAIRTDSSQRIRPGISSLLVHFIPLRETSHGWLLKVEAFGPKPYPLERSSFRFATEKRSQFVVASRPEYDIEAAIYLVPIASIKQSASTVHIPDPDPDTAH